jgi:phage terminase small subunit
MPARHLNEQQAEFARLVATGMSGTDAYIAAYPGNYSRHTASVKASRLLKRPLVMAAKAAAAAAVVAAVDRAVDRYGITAERVADAMARLAFTDLRQVIDWQTVQDGGKRRQIITLRDASAIEADAHQAISEIRRGVGGELTVRLFNKREALMDLARLKGWIADKPVDQRNLVMLKIER